MGALTGLATAASTPASIVILSITTAFLVAKWVYEVYQNTCVPCFCAVLERQTYGIDRSRNMTCVMAYIVDLTVVMHRLSAVDISQERVLSVVKGYARSAEIAQVHNDIRTFCERKSRLRDRDHVLDEIIRLIEKHRDQAPRT
jgi:hypothetical protein